MLMNRTALPLVLALIVALSAGASSLLAQGPPRRDGGRASRPLLRALDTDGDRKLSKAEVNAALASLRALDKNGDGNLEIDEVLPTRDEGEGERGFGGPGGPGGPPPFGRGLSLAEGPVGAILDKDGDGELYDDEVTDAKESLLKFDRDGDGALSRRELTRGRRAMRRRLRGDRGGEPGFGRPPGGGFGGGRRGEGQGRSGGTPAPEELTPEEGAARIDKLETFRALSYQGEEVMIDTHLADLEFVKFQIESTDAPKHPLYFMNTKTFRAHPMFMQAMGMNSRDRSRMRGVLIRWPNLLAPDGSTGLYTFEFEPNDAYPYAKIRLAHDQLIAQASILKGRLAYNVLDGARRQYEKDRQLYVDSGLPIFEDTDRYAKAAYLALHQGEAFGRLRLMDGEELPSGRDIVVYRTLPNEMPRVAGVITAVRQTPLSHVNLRAIQDDVPNAYLADVADRADVKALIGKTVRYAVTQDGWELREATAAEVEAHLRDLRPAAAQTPPRDLNVKKIRSFRDVGFADSKAFGVKAANLAELSRVNLSEAQSPDGYAIPFHFYAAFMKHNRFYAMAERMMANKDFRGNARTREQSLKKFRKAIKKGKMPAWMHQALSAAQGQFAKGASIRCRSSTNNEDLPGFSGAGLYDSYTHHPDEGHLSKSVKQVFASLWNFRAFEERAFYRINHAATAMGVILQLATAEEQANGVAVTRDVLYGTEKKDGVRFYVNAQVGEDLVTNPEAGSIPEELLISPRNPKTDRVIRLSSRTQSGNRLLTPTQLVTLRRALRAIDGHYRALYAPKEGEPFAMEIEFKITKKGGMLIKQARPWVFR